MNTSWRIDAEPQTLAGAPTPLLAALHAYDTGYRNPALPPFALHNPAEVRRGAGGWDHSHGGSTAGVYVVLDRDRTVLYIGKASAGSAINVRLRYWLEVKIAEWVASATTIYHIEVQQPFEAPSLEEFLIRELRPRFNTVGMKVYGW